MISDARGNHVSPGVYTEERDVTYSVKSLGITSLGIVGETLYGPAFENVEIKNWSEFVDYFGGTSTEKFKGTGYPKYELPYIAKSYLEESQRLNVVRVLGLSGYIASKPWVIAEIPASEGKPASGITPVVILRSKMTYNASAGDPCNPNAGDMPTPVVTGITIGKYTEKMFNSECVGVSNTAATPSVSEGEGYFKLIVKCDTTTGYNSEYEYNVNLDPSSSNYIYKVLSNKPDTGTTPVYIEAVYEGSFHNDSSKYKLEIYNDVEEVVTEKKYFKVSFLRNGEEEGDYIYRISELLSEPTTGVSMEITEKTYNSLTSNEILLSANNLNYVWYSVAAKTGATEYNTEKYTDFREGYRAAQTPWIVSDAVVEEGGSGKRTSSMRKLFKFITISDGDAANYQIKVSIQNIKPDKGTFDVMVRDFNDTDSAPLILETFRDCNLVDGDTGFIGFKIGTSDGGFAAKSKYILVEMAEGEDFSNSVPAGFLGYPMPSYGTVSGVSLTYNTEFIPTLKAKKQYFGLSNITGIDSDVFAYKGKWIYSNNGDIEPDKITNGFHMDSAVSGACFVDGISGYQFTTVSDVKVTDTTFAPRLINAPYINQTLYKDVNTRKFTVYFYGGFDGWDVNREQRTNTDEYKSTQYSVNGSSVFSNVIDYNGLNAPLNLPTTAITTDYYAYLAGYRVFANPQDVDINIFATPGIDWYNNTLLTEEAIDVIEDTDDGRGGDALYVMDAPQGFTSDEIADLFADTDINSSYACTYSPWVMYYDSTNKKYLNLPVTKDVVRNMASTDNTSYPWFAPAGVNRGDVDCIRAEYKTTINDEDVLYENRINPVKSFAQDGVKIWGNKTAYNIDSPLNRVNVRRLMIRVKKLVTDASKQLIFEQYDDTLEQQFKGLVEPILSDVKANRGISDYRIITEVTAETKDQQILPAKILVKPIKALEYISISFVIYPESVEFDEN